MLTGWAIVSFKEEFSFMDLVHWVCLPQEGPQKKNDKNDRQIGFRFMWSTFRALMKWTQYQHRKMHNNILIQFYYRVSSSMFRPLYVTIFKDV
jgi:hypothetical protein